MKGLKKIALATAVAAAPFAAQADLKALDDTAMGNVTGQAGVTIELETEVSIGEFRYTDKGSLSVKNVTIGGGSLERDADDNFVKRDAEGNVLADQTQSGYIDASGKLDDLLIDIDIDDDGDAIIDVHSISGGPIDFAMGIGSVSLQSGPNGAGDSTLLASNIGIEGNLGLLNIRVDTASDDLIMNVGFNVTDMDMDVDFLGVNVRDLTVYGSQYYEQVADNGQPIDAAGLFAKAQITVGKAQSAATGGDALEIAIPAFVADIGVGAVEIGGESIGSFRIDNLAVTNTNMKVYGHAD